MKGYTYSKGRPVYDKYVTSPNARHLIALVRPASQGDLDILKTHHLVRKMHNTTPRGNAALRMRLLGWKP